ncbi:hypothetical protein [Catellatospora tritici]|uniref:hypothetical protein n=1 Tax=Catellatospora tritici TaxID=2851566 RepID=UPI001C2D98B8|nr:hypothetical protein [Catellatospora tritici]MBV1853434.1 hypothetical protein [Catellatospora tritici]
MSERSAAWTEYLAAAQRLDTVRREAAEVASVEAAALAAARDELPTVQAQLSLQATRLLASAGRVGVPAPVLLPGPSEQHVAAQAVAGGPAVALAALRQARATLEVTDGSLARFGGTASRGLPRNLLIYAPLSLTVLVVQLALAGLADADARLFYLLVGGLSLALLAFATGWVLVGLVFPKGSRTAPLGAVTCFAPVLLATVLYALG